MTTTPRYSAEIVFTSADGGISRREYDQEGRLIYYRAPDGYEEWYNPDAPSGQQTIRDSTWDGCHAISYPQEG